MANLGYEINGVTANNYAGHLLDGNGSSVRSAAGTSIYGYLSEDLPASSATANSFGVGVIDLVDIFTTTKNKVIRSVFGRVGDGASRVNLVSGLLVNTDALTSFTIVEETGSTLTAGSRFSLYGIKG